MRTINAAVVTGPTGAIGHALCERLLQAGVRVYAVVNPRSARADSLPEHPMLTRVACDLRDMSSLSRLLDSACADAFFHLAWASTTGAGRNDMKAQLENIQAALDACHAAAALGCSVFVGAGSQAEYGRADCALSPDTPCFPENGYGMAKLCAGQMSRVECAKFGIDHIWPRILSVYGPYDGANAMMPQLIRALLAGKKPSLTPGGQIWDYLYAADAAEALYRLARSGQNGGIYPLGSGRARQLREYVEEARDAIDPSLLLGFGEVPYASGQVMHLEADISALQEDTGFTPSTSFSEGIRATIAWLKRQEA